MNTKEYESAMESYDSDDIVLGDINHDNEAHASDMDILLEALDMLPEAEFTAAMESMTDDEIYVIYSALEASHDASDVALNASDNYKEKIAGNSGGLLGKVTDYLAKKGESSLSSGIMNKITQTGTDAGKKDLTRLATLTKNKFTKDEALRALHADQKLRAKGIFSEMWKTGVRNPLAYLAANKKLNKIAADTYKDTADAHLKKKVERDAAKKAKEDFLKAHPEQAASVKLEENRKKEDKTYSDFRKTLSDEGKAKFDKDYIDPLNKSRGRENMLADRQKRYDDAIKAGLSEKEAKKYSGDEDKLKRRFDTLDNRERLKGGFKEGFDALGQTAGARAAKKVGGAIKGGAKEMWKRLTASTGEEIGFDCYNGDDIDIAIESVYESGDTIYTSALEEAYYAARIIESMDDTEIDELMSEMSATESIEFMTCLNYLSDVIDSDIQRDNRIAFESAIESAFSDDESGYSDAYEAVNTKGQNTDQQQPAPQSKPAPAPAPTPAPAPQPAPQQQPAPKPAPAPAPAPQPQQQPAPAPKPAPAPSNPPAPAPQPAPAPVPQNQPAPQQQNQPANKPAEKPSLGTRIKNFFTGKGYNENSGFKQRVSDAFKNARTKVSNWFNGKKDGNSNNSGNSGDKTEKAEDSKGG